MRGERRLLRLGEYLVGRACQRLPPGVREERYREWTAELPVILQDPQVRFAPRRAVRMLGYAADMLRGTIMTPGSAHGQISRLSPAVDLLFPVDGRGRGGAEKGGVRMFERYTDRARRVVVLAQEEARRLDHNYIGTEHILLGLLHEGGGVAARALESQGISLEAARQQVEEIIGKGQRPPSGAMPFTSRMKKVLELAAREADALGNDHVGSEHMLLGLLREGEGVAIQMLIRLGADPAKVRDQVLQLLRGQAERDVAAEDSRRARARLSDDALTRIESLDGRLTAIERWVGMRPDLDDLDQEIAQVRREKEAALERQELETAAVLRDTEIQLLARRDKKEKQWIGRAAGGPSFAGELARVNAELERLRAILRDRGIE
jgi:Clp amino terminal domain, pathogenicity island component